MEKSIKVLAYVKSKKLLVVIALTLARGMTSPFPSNTKRRVGWGKIPA